MKIYLDENFSSGALAGILTHQGHVVVRPATVQLLGSSDPVQLEFAIRELLVVLTSDAEDFSDLDRLIATSGGQHAGIMIVRFENDARHDMKPKHIAVAVSKVEKAGLDLTNQLIYLNQWR